MADKGLPRLVIGLTLVALLLVGYSGARAVRALIVADSSPPLADLAIQAPGSVRVVPGETSVYTLTLGNRGPAPATGIVLTDVFPSGVMPVWVQPARPVCGRWEHRVGCNVGDLRGGDAVTVTLDLSVGGTETLVTSTRLVEVTLDLSAPICAIAQDSARPYVTCHLGELEPGAEAQVPIGVEVGAQMTGTLAHTVTVAANEADADRSNNRAAFSLTVAAASPAVTAVPTATDLIVQADGPSGVIAGQPFTYTFTISNRGALDASGVRFEDVLPPATLLSAYAPGLPQCEQQGDALTCVLYDLDSGETITFALVITGHAGQPMKLGLDPLMPGWPICTVLKERTFLHILNCELGVLKRGQATRVQVALVAEGVQERTMTNTVSVSANEAELYPGDNTDTATISVQVRSDLWLRSAISGPAVAGETLSYTLIAVNAGPSDADDVVLTDTLPLGTSLISATPSQGGDCRIEGVDPSAEGGAESSHVVCRLGRMSGGETVTVTIVVGVGESLTEALLHSARVVAGSVDPNLGNNALTESIPIGPEVEE